jgi:hypothetical protein
MFAGDVPFAGVNWRTGLSGRAKDRRQRVLLYDAIHRKIEPRAIASSGYISQLDDPTFGVEKGPNPNL